MNQRERGMTMKNGPKVGEMFKGENGIVYRIVRAREFVKDGKTRVEYELKRPKGRISYYIVRYENGTYSSIA